MREIGLIFSSPSFFILLLLANMREKIHQKREEIDWVIRRLFTLMLKFKCILWGATRRKSFCVGWKQVFIYAINVFVIQWDLHKFCFLLPKRSHQPREWKLKDFHAILLDVNNSYRRVGKYFQKRKSITRRFDVMIRRKTWATNCREHRIIDENVVCEKVLWNEKFSAQQSQWKIFPVRK